MTIHDLDVKGQPWIKVNAPQPKYCVRCVHYKGYECRHEQNIMTDLVTGETIYINTPHELRSANVIGRCGKSGFWFEEKVVGETPKKAKKSKQDELDECLASVVI